MPGKRVVFLDRDGTINAERHYLSDPDEVELLPGAAGGMKKMMEMGLGLVVVTNQSGLGRGYFDETTLDAIHNRLRALLAEEGVALDGIYFCPHRPEDECDCRKPKPGMITQAAKDMGISPEECFVIGDKACDVNLGKAVGATSILVRTGYGAKAEKEAGLEPDRVVDDLTEAAGVIAEIIKDLSSG